MSSFSGGGAFYGAVELAVNATGAAAVADLEAHVLLLKQQIAGYQQQLKAGTITTVEAQKEMEKLTADLRQAAEAAAAANRVLAGQPAALNATANSAKGATRAVLEFSRAFEDFSVAGPLGALNNVPGVFGGIARSAGLAAPQVAAVEAAASLLATTGYLVYQNWGRVKHLFDDPLSPRLLEGIKDVEAALKSLTDRPWKTTLDVQDMTIAKDQLDELNRAKRGYEGLDAQTEEEKGRGELVSRSIIEGGGRKAVTEAAIAATIGESPAGFNSPETRKAIQEVEKLEGAAKRARAKGNEDAALELEGQASEARRVGNIDQAIAHQNRRTAVERQIGLAAQGDPAQVRWLADLHENNRDKFRAYGVKGSFGQAIGEATPEGQAHVKEVDDEFERGNEALDQSIKDIKDRFDGLRKAGTAAASELKQRTDQAATRVGPGVDDALQKSLFDAIKGGATPDAAMGGQRGGLVHTLRGRGVEEDIVADVAGKILEKASDQALNLINEGATPKLDVKAEAAKKKADDAKAAARKKAVAEVDQGFTNKAVAMMARNDLGVAQGLPVARDARQEQQFRQMGQNYSLPREEMAHRIDDMIGMDLGRAGKDPALAPDIRTRAASVYDTRKAEALANTPMPDPSAIAGAVGARQAQAMAGLAQNQQALITVLGNVGVQVGHVQQLNAQNQAKITGLGQQQGRAQTRRNAFTPTFGGL